jgi:hypothetical protein
MLIFKKGEKHNYSSSCQININGNKATIDTLIGGDFYDIVKREGFAPFKELGLIEVNAITTKSHFRLLNRHLKHSDIHVEETGDSFQLDDTELIWIKFTPK